MWQPSALTWPDSAGARQADAETVTRQIRRTMETAVERLIQRQEDAHFGRHPLSVEAAALLQLREALDAVLVQGTVISATPYQFQVGERLHSGAYLSPANAIQRLAAKLRDLSDAQRPSSELYLVAVMLSAPSLADFVRSLADITRVLRLPDWCQCWRQAQTLSQLEQEKWHQPAAMVPPRFKPFAALNARPLGDYVAAQGAQLATLESLASDAEPVIGKLAALADRRSRRMHDITESLNALKALSGQVYSLSLSGTPESLATQLLQSTPPNHHPLTVASLLLSARPMPFFEELLCSP